MHSDQPSDPPLQYLDRSAGRLCYTDEGCGEQTIVAIAGLPGSLRDFRWLAPVLSPHVRFVRVDLPGFGGSTRRGFSGMTIAQRAEPVRALIEALGLGRVTLVGHSHGSTVVAHLARHAPALVSRCALLCPPGPTPHYPMAAMRALGRVLNRSLGRALLRPLLRYGYTAVGFPAKMTDDERIYTTLDAGAADFAEHRDNLRRATQPTLVAWAQDDRLMPARIYEALEQIAPAGPRLRFADGGHNIQKTHATELGAAILDLLP